MELIYNNTYYKFSHHSLLEDDQQNNAADKEKFTADLKDKLDHYNKLDGNAKLEDPFLKSLQELVGDAKVEQIDNNVVNNAIQVANSIVTSLSNFKGFNK